MKLPNRPVTRPGSAGAVPETFPAAGARPSDCNVMKGIACGAAGVAAIGTVCGFGALLPTPPCIYLLDQLAAIGCCDCIPAGSVRDACNKV